VRTFFLQREKKSGRVFARSSLIKKASGSARGEQPFLGLEPKSVPLSPRMRKGITRLIAEGGFREQGVHTGLPAEINRNLNCDSMGTGASSL